MLTTTATRTLNTNHAYFSQGIQYKQYYFYPKAIFMQYWRTRTFVKIYYSQDKQIKQVNSCFDCQTFSDNLWHFIYFYSNLSQFYNISKFITFYDFMSVSGGFTFMKKNILEEHTSNFFFSGVFQKFFISPGVFPGVKLHSRSF